MKIKLPPGTKISILYHIYKVDYQELLYCEPDCKGDHDCYEEPHVSVIETTRTSVPISQIQHVFDLPNGHGRKFNPETEVER